MALVTPGSSLVRRVGSLTVGAMEFGRQSKRFGGASNQRIFPHGSVFLTGCSRVVLLSISLYALFISSASLFFCSASALAGSPSANAGTTRCVLSFWEAPEPPAPCLDSGPAACRRGARMKRRLHPPCFNRCGTSGVAAAQVQLQWPCRDAATGCHRRATHRSRTPPANRRA